MSDTYDHAGDDRASVAASGGERGQGAQTRLGPTGYALVGVLVGVVIGFGLAWGIGGNPLSDRNEVVYREVTVNSVSPAEDQICWADEPDRRDSPQTCAILALDPEVPVPSPGATVMIGLVDLDTPDGAEFRQVVHLGPPPAPEAEDDPEGEPDAEDDAEAGPDADAEDDPEAGPDAED